MDTYPRTYHYCSSFDYTSPLDSPLPAFISDKPFSSFAITLSLPLTLCAQAYEFYDNESRPRPLWLLLLMIMTSLSRLNDAAFLHIIHIYLDPSFGCTLSLSM